MGKKSESLKKTVLFIFEREKVIKKYQYLDKVNFPSDIKNLKVIRTKNFS